jgi:glutaredoxin 3
LVTLSQKQLELIGSLVEYFKFSPVTGKVSYGKQKIFSKKIEKNNPTAKFLLFIFNLKLNYLLLMESPLCAEFENMLKDHNIIVVGADFCPACVKAKNMLKKENFKHLDFNISGENESNLMQECILPKTKTNYIPQIFVNKKYIGGYSELRYLVERDLLNDIVKKEERI